MDDRLGLAVSEQLEHQRRLSALLQSPGYELPPAPDGPVVERFDALELAQALEHELQRAAGRGLTKIQINMNFVDAQALANCLRRAALMGA